MNSDKLKEIADFYQQTPQEMYDMLSRQMILEASMFMFWMAFFAVIGVILTYLRIVFNEWLKENDLDEMFSFASFLFLALGWTVFIFIAINADDTYSALFNPEYQIVKYIRDFDLTENKPITRLEEMRNQRNNG